MKFYTKTILIAILLFLTPFTFEIGVTDYLTPEVNLTTNIAYAIDLDCGPTEFSCGVKEGILGVWEILWFYTTQIGVALIGYVLDIFVFLSIYSQFYRSGLIETGWEILRDFTNIVFIFSFILMAFKMVLGVDGAKVKQQFIKTVLIALTVNFSLFISFAVIDASNLLAHVFYNKIDAKAGYNVQTTGDASTSETETSLSGLVEDLFGDEDVRSVSLAIAGNVNPQLIISGNASKGFFENFLIITGAGLINILLIFVFVKMIAVFLGRTLGLMFSSMLSALAFVSLTIPGMENKSYVGFNKWLQELISAGFMAPTFLFFIYLAVIFLNDKGFLASLASQPDTGVLARIIIVFVPFLVIGGVLMVAKKISSDMVGELGNSAVKGVGMLAGGVIGAPVVVAGGVAAVGGVAAGVGGALAAGAGRAASRAGAKGLGSRLSSGGRTSMKVGRKLFSFKADPTKLPGFKTLVGKDNAKAISKVTGKSPMQHLNDLQNRKGAFENEDKKLQDKKDNEELKKANQKAKEERRKAESKFDAELYQKRLDAEKARKKMEDDTNFKNIQGKNGGVKEAEKQSKNEEKNIAELNKTLKELKENGVDANYSGSDLDKNTAAQEKRDQIQELETKISVSQDNKQTADTYIQNVAVEYNNKKQEADNLRNKQKEAGDIAEGNSRFKSASKASSDEVANKIISKSKAKGTDFAAAVKKAMKENNMTLDDDK